jgi:hypothetical protein
MGDNRTDSEDSRYFGPISSNLIVGKMAFVVWPLDEARVAGGAGGRRPCWSWLVAVVVVAGTGPTSGG